MEALKAATEDATVAQRAFGDGIVTTIPKLKEAKDKTDELAEATKRAAEKQAFFDGIADDAFDALIPKINTGVEALDRLVEKLIEAVAQAALLGSGPLAGVFGGSLLSLLTPTPAAPVTFNPFSIYHGGGEVGKTNVPKGYAPAGAFANAPRLHDGLAGDEFTAILKRGETVIPEGGRAVNAGVTVNQFNDFSDIDPANEARLDAKLAVARQQIKAETIAAVDSKARRTPAFLRNF